MNKLQNIRYITIKMKVPVYNDRLGYIGATLKEITRSLVAQWIKQRAGKEEEVIGSRPRVAFFRIFSLFFSTKWWCSIPLTLPPELDKAV